MYLDKTILELHALLVDKKITPLDLAKEAIEKAKLDNNNAFEYIAEKEALDFASSLTTPEIDNPLWGIPFLAKDNISTKDIPTTSSSNILKGYVPVYDATVISKLKEKKAVLIGKTTLDELAMGGTGTTGHLGTTYNPFDKTHTRHVGGSSAGSAASVAANIVPFALGSDTGDSVRKPASYAGLVGFKGTWGRISRFGLFPFAPSLDHIGYFTRCVEDSAILLNALAGRDLEDSSSSEVPCEDYLSDINKGIKGKKFIVINEILNSIKDKDILNEFNNLLNKLKNEGALIVFESFDKELLNAMFATYFVISCAEATSNNANLDGIKFGPFYEEKTYQESINKVRTLGFGELIKRRFVIGSFSLMSSNVNELFKRAQKARRLIVNKTNEILSKGDAIILPAAPTIAPKFNEKMDRLSDEYLIADNYLVLGNFAGLPSITIPLGLKQGMPFGINLMSKAFSEKDLFRYANAAEKLIGLRNLSAKEAK